MPNKKYRVKVDGGQPVKASVVNVDIDAERIRCIVYFYYVVEVVVGCWKEISRQQQKHQGSGNVANVKVDIIFLFFFSPFFFFDVDMYAASIIIVSSLYLIYV